jgi:hypothetical protein
VGAVAGVIVVVSGGHEGLRQEAGGGGRGHHGVAVLHHLLVGQNVLRMSLKIRIEIVTLCSGIFIPPGANNIKRFTAVIFGFS